MDAACINLWDLPLLFLSFFFLLHQTSYCFGGMSNQFKYEEEMHINRGSAGSTWTRWKRLYFIIPIAWENRPHTERPRAREKQPHLAGKTQTRAVMWFTGNKRNESKHATQPRRCLWASVWANDLQLKSQMFPSAGKGCSPEWINPGRLHELFMFCFEIDSEIDISLVHLANLR